MKLRDLFEVTAEKIPRTELGDLLNSGASEYLSTTGVGAGFLYRGMKIPLNDYTTEELFGTELSWVVIKARRNRTPLSTPKVFSDAADEFFNKRFHWTPRKDGTFAVNDLSLARDYGEGHVFIPLGVFQYIWSEEVPDLYIAYDEIKEGWQEEGLSKDEMLEKWSEFLESSLYTNRKIDAAIKTRHEIMFDCDHYLLVRLPMVHGANGAGSVLKILSTLTGISDT